MNDREKLKMMLIAINAEFDESVYDTVSYLSMYLDNGRVYVTFIFDKEGMLEDIEA